MVLAVFIMTLGAHALNICRRLLVCINVTPSSLHDGTAYNHRHILDTYGDRRTRAYKYYVNAFSPFPSLGNVFLFSSLLLAIVHLFSSQNGVRKGKQKRQEETPLRTPRP